MRLILTGTLLAITLGSPRPALAQTREWPERIWFSVGGGVQPAANGFSDTLDVPLYPESEKVSIAYPVKGGAVVAASGGYRGREQLALGHGGPPYNGRARAAVASQGPRPVL